MRHEYKIRRMSAASIPLLLLFVVTAAAGAATIKIGAILALSGNSAAQGQNVRDGLLLAVDEINKRGGVNGARIELVVEDSKTDPQAAVSAFNKIENSERPLLYVSQLSAVGSALAPLVEEKHVVLAGLVTAATDFTRGREWVFRYWPMGLANTRPLLMILKDLKVRKLGILYQNEEYGKDQQRLMAEEFTRTGGNVTSEKIELAEKDFRSRIEELRDTEAVFLAVTGAILSEALKELRETGFRGAILTTASASQPALFSRPEAEGLYLAATIIHNPNYLYARDAGSKFEARFKKAFDQWAASGYDFVKLVTGLLEDRQMTRQAVREALAGGYEYSGVFGHLSVRPGEHDIAFPLYPAQVDRGTLKYR
jgi:branched-chain amino acid transport system substrate-binding protein